MPTSYDRGRQNLLSIGGSSAPTAHFSSRALENAAKVGSEVSKRYNPRAESARKRRESQRKARKEGLKIERAPSGKRGQGGRPFGDTTYRNEGRLKRPKKEQGKGRGNLMDWIRGLRSEASSQAMGSPSGADKISSVGNAAVSVLNAIDMLTGGQDKILPGSGHTYSSGYNPEMYIGRTV